MADLETDAKNVYLESGDTVEEAFTNVEETFANYPKYYAGYFSAGNVTAGTPVTVDLSTATNGVVTTFAQVIGIGLKTVDGSSTLDYQAGIQVYVDNKIRFRPSVTQNSVGVRFFILYK